MGEWDKALFRLLPTIEGRGLVSREPKNKNKKQASSTIHLDINEEEFVMLSVYILVRT